MGKPLIGVTPWYDYSKNITYIKPGYCEGIIEAGGMPVLLPLTANEDILTCLMDEIDGLLLSGGPDVDARLYGEQNLPFNGEISPHRDKMEMFLAKKAILDNKPLLGICRGMQVMNAAMGGTLFQDIYSQSKSNSLVKHSQDAPKWYPTHDIHIEKDSRVAASFGKHYAGVNSFHHQAVKDVAEGFKVTAMSVDGIIEAVEYEDHIFAVGVQWHPELMWQENGIYLKLFIDFVCSCVK
ncbi:MAG: gamma-glutamyl-gamma-aminobutyrate hydrolase family protein [Clostridia bacterium]|nr:gamma-glutamyl-gamma-aminobutyrate hydrolase family protein [Clostridia bacterium]